MAARCLFSLGLLCVLVGFVPACTAELEEGCLSGECSPPGKPPVPSVDDGLSCGTTPATGDYPCDVFTVLDTHCNFCHGSPLAGGAPFPLLTYEDSREFAGMTTDPRWKRIGVAVASGVMPPGTTMPAADKQILLDWVAACAPPAESMGCE